MAGNVLANITASADSKGQQNLNSCLDETVLCSVIACDETTSGSFKFSTKKEMFMKIR